MVPACVATIGVEDLRVVRADDREPPSDSWRARIRGTSGLLMDPRAAGSGRRRGHSGDCRRDRARGGATTRRTGDGSRVGAAPARHCLRHPRALRLAGAFLDCDGTRDAELVAIDPIRLPVIQPVPLGQRLSYGLADPDRSAHLQLPRRPATADVVVARAV
jgi:hypothetical protein